MWYNYKNGNYNVVINSTTGTKVRYTEQDVFIPDRPESIDVKITNKCNHGCLFCHENSVVNGKEAEYDVMKNFASQVPPYTEIACGGGNLMCNPEHTEFFLRELKKSIAFPCITVQQQDFIDYNDIIKEWVDNNFVYGIGVSVNNPKDEKLHTYLKKYPNAVIHTIVGMYDESYFKDLIDNNYKILFLGFKHFRRGNKYYFVKKNMIDQNTAWLRDNIFKFTTHFQVMSFDNLALEQLNIKENMSADDWQRYYNGDDGQFTFYVDLVEQTYAMNSTSLDRFYINNQTPAQMFKDIRSKYVNN